MHPATKDLWEILVKEARLNPFNGCGNRAIQFATLVNMLEDYKTLYVVQFLPRNSDKDLHFAPIPGLIWKTHYVTMLDEKILDASIGEPLKFKNYITKAFPEQAIQAYYYDLERKNVFTPEHAIKTEEI